MQTPGTRAQIIHYLTTVEEFAPRDDIASLLAAWFDDNGYKPEEFNHQKIGPWEGTALFYMYDVLADAIPAKEN